MTLAYRNRERARERSKSQLAPGDQHGVGIVAAVHSPSTPLRTVAAWAVPGDTRREKRAWMRLYRKALVAKGRESTIAIPKATPPPKGDACRGGGSAIPPSAAATISATRTKASIRALKGPLPDAATASSTMEARRRPGSGTSARAS